MKQLIGQKSIQTPSLKIWKKIVNMKTMNIEKLPWQSRFTPSSRRREAREVNQTVEDSGKFSDLLSLT